MKFKNAVSSSKQQEKGGCRMKKFRLSIALVSVLMVIILTGCGSNALVGTWVEDTEYQPETLEFFSDGTGIISNSSKNISYTVTSWLTENDRLKVTMQVPLLGEYTAAYDYEVNKDTLILTNDDGEETVYIKE